MSFVKSSRTFPEAADIPQQIGCCIRMQPEEAVMLHKLLNQLLSVIEPDDERK